jgi:tripartite-type tricarboxylate transporter receptor subunit TctC
MSEKFCVNARTSPNPPQGEAVKSKIGSCIVAALTACGACPAPAAGISAQAFPNKPVRIIVPWPAGGGSDIVARILTQKMGESVGQQFVVDNRGGAAGIIGTALAAKANADGYTILLGNSATNVTNAVLYSNLDFDVVKDFEPVSLAASSPYFLSVHPGVPAKTVQELVALAKAKPGYLNYGTGGNGSAPHFAAALFNYMARTEMTHVPYKGGAGHTAAVIGGEVHLNFTSPLEVMGHIKAGRLRALGVTSLARWSSAPEVPTVSESGVPGYEFTGWWGVLAPAGTPWPIIARLHTEVVSAVRVPQVKEKLAAQGVDTVGNSPEQFAKLIATELETWRKVAKAVGIKAD